MDISAKSSYFDGFSFPICGYIFLTRNPNTFFRVFLADLYDKRNAILNSLRSDGYVIDTEETLKFHTFVTMFKHPQHFPNYSDPKVLLPKELKDGMDEFMRIQKCKDFYDKVKREYNDYNTHHHVEIPLSYGHLYKCYRLLEIEASLDFIYIS